MKLKIATGFALFALALFAQVKVLPPPIFRPVQQRADEKPVEVETVREIVADNGLYQRIETTITFTNPNDRTFEGELEFPLADGAVVCGYELEVNGTMVPGVICEKEAARTAFENEKRQRADPGLVEQVKGNVWKTRIHPLLPRTPRKAKIVQVAPIEKAKAVDLAERDGEYVYYTTARSSVPLTSAERLRKATKATLYWDASMSRQDNHQADRNLLECLPETGTWTLVVFRNVLEAPLAFTSRAELLKAVDALVYDGGTCLAEVDKVARRGEDFIFTDERDEDAAARRPFTIIRQPVAESKVSAEKEGTLLATAWAAQRVEELAANAEQHKEELLALGRRYGVASSVTSLIVLETLEQYLRYKIEPPKGLSFHDEWVKRRAAEDDPIAAEKEKAEYRQRLLTLWEERVKWWNDPIPPKVTPKSGVFEGEVQARAEMAMDTAVEDVQERNGMIESVRAGWRAAGAAAPTALAKTMKVSGEVPPSGATVKIAAWDPKTPYLDALKKADDGYAEYLRQRETYGNSPAFYLDCAGWFFKQGKRVLAIRIISNLTEMKLENAALWRTMGWRLREAGAYDEAIAVFRHVLELRGEEPQSRRDLALVLTERGKELFAQGKRELTARDHYEAMKLLHAAAFQPTARRSGRRGNDMQTAVLALEELNGLIGWCEAQNSWGETVKFNPPLVEEPFRRSLPLQLRIVMSWDADQTDIDLHVLEPDGEEAFYGHRRTSSGGFVSEDVTTGYGPEEYLRKTADKGVYKIKSNYFASHQQALTGAATVTATVYTDWATRNERRQVFSFRLDKPKDRQTIGEVRVD